MTPTHSPREDAADHKVGVAQPAEREPFVDLLLRSQANAPSLPRTGRSYFC